MCARLHWGGHDEADGVDGLNESCSILGRSRLRVERSTRRSLTRDGHGDIVCKRAVVVDSGGEVFSAHDDTIHDEADMMCAGHERDPG